MVPFKVRGRAWLFIIKSAFLLLLFFLLPFLEKPLKNAPVRTQMGAIFTLSHLNKGRGQGSVRHRASSRMEVNEPPLASSHPPTLSQPCDHSRVQTVSFYYGMSTWHGIGSGFHLFKNNKVETPVPHFPPYFSYSTLFVLATNIC